MEQAWMKPLSAHDLEVLEALGFGGRQGFGERPALLAIDCNYDFCGADDVAILEAIRRWRNACGEHAWAAVRAMRPLMDACRAAGLPVFYSTNTRRADGFDSGSWRWKSEKRSGEPGAAASRASREPTTSWTRLRRSRGTW